MDGSLINLNGSSVNKLLSSSISLFLLRSLTAIFEISISFRIGCESSSEVNILLGIYKISSSEVNIL